MKRLAWLTLLFLMALSTARAHAQPAAEIDDLAQRIRALQAELERLSSGTPAPAPRTSAAADGLAKLAEDLQALDQRVRILQRSLELEREQAAERAAAQPVMSAGREGFLLKSADGAFQLKLRGYVQSDGRFYASGGHASTPATFLLRRVRPVVEATMFRVFDVKVMPDFGEGRVVLQESYIDARLRPFFNVRAGKIKSPFGLERLASALDLLFIERAAPTLLAPNRDLGLMFHGAVAEGRVTYQAAVVNGVVDGGSADLDDREGKDVIGRVFYEPFRKTHGALKGLGVGFAGSAGREIGTRATPGLPTFRTAGAQTFFRYRADATADGTAVADGDRVRTSLQGYWYYDRFGVLAEQTVSRQQVRAGAVSRSIDNAAWVVAGSVVLTGEAASYRGVQARRDFDPASGRWGAIELTGRVTRLAVDRDAFPVLADPAAAARTATEWAAGANWYLNRSVKCSLSFHETRFAGGAVVGDRPTERDVLTRMQFAF